jgi:hypothetical protein
MRPVEEAQVDYFRGALTLHPDTGRYQRPWVFRLTLCHSRHGYEEAVWGLDLPSFLRLHERGFGDFGGVVEVVRHDNMAAGVSRACFYDPDSNVKYLAFAQHWRFTPRPSRTSVLQLYKVYFSTAPYLSLYGGSPESTPQSGGGRGFGDDPPPIRSCVKLMRAMASRIVGLPGASAPARSRLARASA